MVYYVRHEREQGLQAIAACEWAVEFSASLDDNIVLTEKDCAISREVKTPSVSRLLDLCDSSKGVVVDNTPSLHFCITPLEICALPSAELRLHVVLICTPLVKRFGDCFEDVETQANPAPFANWNCMLTPRDHTMRGFDKISQDQYQMSMRHDGMAVVTSRYDRRRDWKGINIQISSVTMGNMMHPRALL